MVLVSCDRFSLLFLLSAHDAGVESKICLLGRIDSGSGRNVLHTGTGSTICGLCSPRLDLYAVEQLLFVLISLSDHSNSVRILKIACLD